MTREQIRASIDAHFAAARRALRLVRVYRAEPRSSGRREGECLRAVAVHRAAIAKLRRETPVKKQCACCGREHTARQWDELPLCGVMPSGVDDEPDLELRNCACGSTIAIEMPRHAA